MGDDVDGSAVLLKLAGDREEGFHAHGCAVTLINVWLDNDVYLSVLIFH